MATLYKVGENWYINYSWKGRQFRKSTGTKVKKLAVLLLKRIEAEIVLGQHNPDSDSSRPQNSISEFFKRYIGFSKSTKSKATNLSDINRIHSIQEYFARKGIKFLEEITPSEIQLMQSFIRLDRNERTYNNYLNLLKAMLNKAVEWDVIKTNPIKKVKPLPVPKKIRYLINDEIDRLREVADPKTRLLLDLAIYAGLRRAEIYYLRWNDIDLVKKIIHIRAHGDFVPKNKKPSVVPINSKLQTILKPIYPKRKSIRDDQYVFKEYHRDDWSNPTIHLSKRFASIAKKAGIRNIGLHTCRHTFASHLVQGGVPLLVVKELLRHTDIKSTMVYAHLAPDPQHQAIEILTY